MLEALAHSPYANQIFLVIYVILGIVALAFAGFVLL